MDAWMVERMRDAYEILRRVSANDGQDALDDAGRGDLFDEEAEEPIGTRDGLCDDILEIIGFVKEHTA